MEREIIEQKANEMVRSWVEWMVAEDNRQLAYLQQPRQFLDLHAMITTGIVEESTIFEGYGDMGKEGT